MDEGIVTIGFLCYKSNVHEFLHNVFCQISETMLFTNVAPVVMCDNLCFLFYKHIDSSRFEVYKAVNSILNYNICNFFNRYRMEFEKHFERGLTLLRTYLKMDLGRTISNDYVILPGDVPIYGYMQNPYVRERIDLDNVSSTLVENPE